MKNLSLQEAIEAAKSKSGKYRHAQCLDGLWFNPGNIELESGFSVEQCISKGWEVLIPSRKVTLTEEQFDEAFSRFCELKGVSNPKHVLRDELKNIIFKN
jgi:hypothetical protein